jgi:Fe-S-cluster containining protein
MWFFKEKIYFSCNQCGECCRGMDVPLTHYDIYRIMQSETKLSLDTFISLKPSVKNDLDAVFLYGFYNTLFLSNQLKDNSCIFLENSICTIYQYRPNSCRTWPFSTNSLNHLQIDQIAEQLVNVSCDKKRFKNHNETRKNIENGINEVIEYRKLVREWNQKEEQDSELEDFVEFIFKAVK